MTEFDWLNGLRVLDLTTAWAGPAVGRFLGAFGADVVKVESARRFDIWRGAVNQGTPSAAGNGHSYNQAPNFNGLNRNKRAISLELTKPEGRDIYLKLVSRADAMVTNFTARVLPNLHLEFEDLAAVNPRLVLLNMPSLGATGPYRDLAGYGSIVEGLGGLAARFGYKVEGARVSQTFFPDGVAGIHAALTLLAALHQRDKTGSGLLVDLSQQETMWMQLGEDLVMSSLLGRVPERMENGESRRVPSGLFRTGDGAWIALVVKSDAMFEELRRLAHPHLDCFRGLATQERIERRPEIEAATSVWAASATTAEQCLSTLEAAGIRATLVNNYESGSQAPELRRVDAFERVGHAEVGSKTYLRVPIRIDGKPIDTRLPGTRFSEHTAEVLHEWMGLQPGDIQELRELGVVVDKILAID